MPIARIGYGTDFILKNQGVGVATDTTDVKLEVGGTTKANYNISGIASLANYAGFAAAEQSIDGTLTLTGEHSTLGDIVVGIGSTFIVSSGSTVEVGTVPSVSIGTHFSPPTGGVEERPEVPVEGTVRFNRDLNTLEFYNGVDWRQFTVSGASGRCLRMGGSSSNTEHASSIEYVNINTKGNGINFGDLLNPTDGNSAVSSSTRAVNMGGWKEPGSTLLNVMDYTTIASEGNAIDFGDLQQGARYMSAATNGNRGLVMNGQQPGYTTMINALNISTLGNAIDTGGEYTASKSLSSCVYSPIRMVIVSGWDPSAPNDTVNTMQHINITSDGNTSEFGECMLRSGSGVSNNTRGIIGAGWNGKDRVGMHYISISSLGELIEFGNLTPERSGAGQGNASSQTRGLFMGGSNPTKLNIIDYVNFQTLGDAIDFGDLTGTDIVGGAGIAYPSVTSDSHGGLGGY